MERSYVKRLYSPTKSPPGNQRNVKSRRSLNTAFGADIVQNKSSRKKRTQYSDRFVPSRGGGNLTTNFRLMQDEKSREKEEEVKTREQEDVEQPRSTYAAVIKTEMFGGECGARRSLSLIHI